MLMNDYALTFLEYDVLLSNLGYKRWQNGLHADHVAFGISWMGLLLINCHLGIPGSLLYEKIIIFSYYWHFVDAIWVLILIIVYLPYLL